MRWHLILWKGLTRLLIRPVAEYDDAKGGYEVKYYQTKLISSEEKVSEGIPDK